MTEIRELFNPKVFHPAGSASWNLEIFKRAYCQGLDAPFEKVCRRLESENSVLVYLPGNCMRAAADYIKGGFGEEEKKTVWKEFGKHPGRDKSIVDAWKASGSIIDDIINFFTNKAQTKPKAIFHNLDLLCDSSGSGIYQNEAAQTAFFSLIEGIRSGVVLGLADRSIGQLPTILENAFSEIVRLEAIDFADFNRIIPQDLAAHLTGGADTLPDNLSWLIASRLRWTDPLRAVTIMRDAVNRSNERDLNSVLSEIWKGSRNIGFIEPRTVHLMSLEEKKEHDKIPEAYPLHSITLLKDRIIAPFKNWINFGTEEFQSIAESGTIAQARLALKKLPPGVILFGPPGTGKTVLAQWIASELGLPYKVINSADIKAGEYGKAEKNVHKVFQEARKAAPCIIILDDADDLLPDRASASGSVASAERGIVNAALQELWGTAGKLDGVLVILTTNRFQSLDRAAKTRFNIHIHVPYPRDKEQVERIVKSIADELKYSLDKDSLEELIEYFFGWMIMGNTADNKNPNDRDRIENDLFAPRDIYQAMLHLENFDKSKYLNSYYRPIKDDIVRMQEYYRSLLPSNPDQSRQRQ